MEQRAAAMVSSMMRVDRQHFHFSFSDTFGWSLKEAFSKDNHYTLFRYEDWPQWVFFSTVFAFLIVFDHSVLNRNTQSLTILRAALYTLFWIFCAGVFCCWVGWWYGKQHAYMWMSGYMLEWLLSFDNLFVFHLIFSTYQTPEHLKHRPLYYGICGAVVFRLVFIFIGEYLMHALYFMHLVFGGFLVYTGAKTLMVDDEDDDPSQHPLVMWLTSNVPFVNMYDEKGAFFVRVPVNENGEALCLEEESGGAPMRPPAGEGDCIATRKAGYGTVDFAQAMKLQQNMTATRQKQLRATMLFLVVCCLEVSDILFAVDSVSAIVAQVNDLFLAYTSAVFAMLGLRATFFIIEGLAQLFSLLKYGVAGVLIFIGVKLMLSRVWHVPPGIVCMILVSCLTLSMVASVVKERWEAQRGEEDQKLS